MESASGGQDGHHHFSGTHYVVSEDVDILIARWCRGVNLLPPDKDFYLGLRSKMKAFLEDIFAKVTFIDSQEIRNGLLESIAQYKRNGFTIVSLERVYLEDSEVDGRIELTRTVDNFMEGILIRGVRYGTAGKLLQFARHQGKKKLVLVDDVVFSGKTLIETISELHHYQANVHAIVAAVGVKSGVDHLKEVTFGIIGMPDHLAVDCLEEFDDVSDQVCERDFYPGIPYSGREHCGSDTAFPYVHPFGNPHEWASIPDKEIKQFSALCLDNTIALFEEIEKINGITIPCSMVPRPVYGLPKDQTHFVSVLREQRVKCLKES